MVYFDKKEVRGMRKTFIFGHKKPDSDSVMAAIGLSYLKNKLGDNTEPRVLGNINKESSFALKYFGLKEPKYLNDVKLQLKDVNYHRGVYEYKDRPIKEVFDYMNSLSLTGIPIVDLATRAILGEKLTDMGYEPGLQPELDVCLP